MVFLATLFKFDAGNSYDNEDGVSSLKARWDWENDGNWDTDYSTTSRYKEHQYSSGGIKTVKLEIRDTDGRINTTTKEINVIIQETGTVTDIDGNVYKTVKIGDQWWMAENLKVTRYANGNEIPYIKENIDFSSVTSGAYCYTDIEAYGMLYNWYAVTDNRKIAPEGWHVPSTSEWKELRSYLSSGLFMGSGAGERMKESGTTHWNSPEGTNDCSFTALPGGIRFGYTYFFLGSSAYFWTTNTYSNRFSGDAIELNHGDPLARRVDHNKQYGSSVRCVKD